MKILLYGDWRLNAGPYNVNRSIIQHSDQSLLYIKSRNKLLSRIESFFKILEADIILFSCSGRYNIYKLAKKLEKKIIILKHGDSRYENEINNLQTSEALLNEDKKEMDIADELVCVSKVYSEWFAKHYPQYSNKITWVNNGVTISPRPKVKKDGQLIALGGGNRSIKNNLNVLRAIEKLNERGANLKVLLFGRHYEGNPPLTSFSFVEFMGQMNKSEYYALLDKTALYVDAAYCESFGLSVADAVNCNCSLLLSDNVGFLSIVRYQDCDVVHNCNDIEEIASKIEYLLSDPNARRLQSSIDISTCSEDYAYQRLKKICVGLLNNKIVK